MNEKLKAFIYTGLPGPRRGGGGPRRALVHMIFAQSRAEQYHVDNPRFNLRLSFHHRLIEKTRWMPGDLLDLQVKEDGTMYVFQSSQGGRKLCKVESNASGRYFVIFGFTEAMLPTMDCPAIAVEAVPGRVAFKLPEGIST